MNSLYSFLSACLRVSSVLSPSSYSSLLSLRLSLTLPMWPIVVEEPTAQASVATLPSIQLSAFQNISTTQMKALHKDMNVREHLD